MNVRRRFLFALVASILLHLGIATAPGWYLPSLDKLLRPKQAQPLDAWLTRQETQAAPVPIPPTPKKPRLAKPKASPNAVEIPNMPVSAPAGPTPEPTPAAESPPAAADAPAAETPPPFNPELLALHVRIHYSVTMGERGLVIGEAVQDIDNDGLTYQLRSTTETTGMARLFKRVDLTHTSTGDIVDGHLLPREFAIVRDGRLEDWARFDWTTGRVTLSRERSLPLDAGTQDMLSVFCELSLIAIDGPSVSLPVVTGKKVERYEFRVIGNEQLATPMGEQPSLHLRTVGTGPEATDIWLGLNLSRLPIRIRHVDRNGEVFDQLAGNVEVIPTHERPH